MKRGLVLLALLLGLFTITLRATTSIALTIQEALYPGSMSGIARTNEPVTMGIPLPDTASGGATGISSLGLTGASFGQFRVLGTWPSGRAKWVEVDTQASLSAGATNTSFALTNTGSGNFGGSNIASDGGATITVTTGAATFTIQKANFDGFHTVVVGATTVVSAGASTGLVVVGPSAGNTTCGTCTTLYTSKNDASSTCSIEENGPVRAAVKCTGHHNDGAGHNYMAFTVRMHFYQGQTRCRVQSAIQNADLGASNTFASAFKGYQAYEFRVVPNISGTLTYTIANHTGTPTTGTMSGTDSVYLYQGASNSMKFADWCGSGCVPYTADSGYTIVKNGSTLIGGSASQYPEGWADIADASGVGMSIGVYQLSAYWPKSLEFDSGGNDVRIGIWARQNSQPYYAPWPQYARHDLWFDFHTTNPASVKNNFLRYQHYLLGRAPYTQYNTAGVFAWTLMDPTAEDAQYETVRLAGTPTPPAPGSWGPIQDFGTSSPSWPLAIYRYFAWANTGPSTQTEFHWSRLLNWLTRGMSGRYLDAAHFYTFVTEQAEPRSDGFFWKDQAGQIDGFARPNVTSTNSGLAFTNWRDQEHGHYYGLADYYYLSGDEFAKDALNNGFLNWHLANPAYQTGTFGGRNWTVNTAGVNVTTTVGAALTDEAFYPGKSVQINGVNYFVATRTSGTTFTLTATAGTQTGVAMFAEGGLFNSRSVGVNLASAARLGTFLADQGDSADAATVFANADLLFSTQVKGASCSGPGGFPVPCTIATIDGGPFYTEGVNRERGFHWGPAGTSASWCVVPHVYRVNSALQMGILNGGLLEYRRARGTGWADYWVAGDLAYAASNWALTENGVWSSSAYNVNGFRFGLAFDRANSCLGPGESPEPDYAPTANETVWPIFTAQNVSNGSSASWQQKAYINLQKNMVQGGLGTDDWGSYFISDMFARLATPGNQLSIVPITGLTDNGGGNYTIQWTVPANAVSYRIKWGPKTLVDWIGFDPTNNVFTGAPATTMNWFAANDATSIPAPGTPGTTQSLLIATGILGLGGGTTGGGHIPLRLLTRLGSGSIGAGGTGNFSVKAFITSGGGGGTPTGVTWTEQSQPATFPGPNGYIQAIWDPVSNTMIHYSRTVAQSTIYSTTIWFYTEATNTYTTIGGNTTNYPDETATCAVANASNQPANHHPVAQMAVDTKRNRMYMFGGVCQGAVRTATYYLSLNANNSTDAWTLVSDFGNYPGSSGTPYGLWGSMTYDPDDDVILWFGTTSGNGPDAWLFCPTTSGTLGGTQITAGCVAADTWVHIASSITGSALSAQISPQVVWSPASHEALVYGGSGDCVSFSNVIKSYKPSTKVLTLRATSGTQPVAYMNGGCTDYGTAYDPVHQKLFYHQVGGTGAPQDYMYDPLTDQWTLLTTTGSGPAPSNGEAGMSVVYDTLDNVLLARAIEPISSQIRIWIGVIH